MIDTEFIEALASEAPTPGGGGASAYCGALAAALAAMVGNLTIGKKKYASVEEEVQESLRVLGGLRRRLIELVDEDAEAFKPVAAVYRMPKDTPEDLEARRKAMQDAIDLACDVPLQIIDVCLDLLEQCEFMAKFGSKMVRSDAAAAAILAKAAIQSASLSVFVNIASMENKRKAAAYRELTNRKVRKASLVADLIYANVIEEVDARYGDLIFG